VILAAADGRDTAALSAWEQLCRSYWYPLYAYLRRSGHGPHDAQDLTQGFIASLIEKHELQGVQPGRGKFRSFLLCTLKHYLSDERRKARAQKRGGGQPLVSIDEDAAEARFRIEPADEITPETLFERQWGLAVLERVMEQLRRQQERRGKSELFSALQPCLGGSRLPVSYRDLGARLGLSEDAVKATVHRLRKEFGRLLRAEVAQTVAHESEIDDEIRHLIQVTSG
jgi:RNA polymerase sigma-70 factor (ECF subfamily)